MGANHARHLVAILTWCPLPTQTSGDARVCVAPRPQGLGMLGAALTALAVLTVFKGPVERVSQRL